MEPGTPTLVALRHSTPLGRVVAPSHPVPPARRRGDPGLATRGATGAIALHFDAEEGHLRLDCREEEFLRIRDLVLAAAPTDGRLTPCAGGIRSIVVRPTAAARDPRSRRGHRGSLIVLGALALALSLATQVIGIVAVTRWLGGLGS